MAVKIKDQIAFKKGILKYLKKLFADKNLWLMTYSSEEENPLNLDHTIHPSKEFKITLTFRGY